MLIKKYIFFACIFIIVQSKAQNLVPNPSFELYSLCPTRSNHIGQKNNLERYCQNWESLGTIQEYWADGAQYANACANEFDNFISVPRNSGGYQNAKTGNAFILTRCQVLGNKHNRIFQGINLLAPMQMGKQYAVSFYINLMDTSDQACNNIGITFFTQKPTIIDTSSPTSQFYPNRAHVYCKDIITDTAQWVKISDVITADSAYTYLAVGNFFNFNKTQFKTLQTILPNFTKLHNSAHYYLDDFSVEEVNKNIQTINPIVCKGSTVQLEATGLATNYYWSLNKTDIFSKNENINIKIDSNQTVYLVKPWGIDSVQLIAVESPQKIIPTDTFLCLENYFEINGNTDNATGYEWNTGETTQKIKVDKSGMYILKTTLGNCYRLDTTEVNFCEPTIFIPNAFTPNGDGLNDVFKPFGNQVRNYTFEIYSSWGQLLFQSNNINNGWDGNQFPSGVYFYSIVFTNDTGEKKFRFGSTFNLTR